MLHLSNLLPLARHHTTWYRSYYTIVPLTPKRRRFPYSHALTDRLIRTLSEMLPNSCNIFTISQKFIICLHHFKLRLIDAVKVLSTTKLIRARLGLSWTIYANVDSPNLGFAYPVPNFPFQRHTYFHFIFMSDRASIIEDKNRIRRYSK